MVGYFRDSAAKEGVNCAVNQLKSRTSNVPEIRSFDREGGSTELDCLSLTPLEPFVDFDFIDGWIEEMQVPDSAECVKAERGSGLGEDCCLENLVGNISPEGMDELVVKDRDGIVGIVKPDGLRGSSLSDFVKADLGSAETKHDGPQGDISSSNKSEDLSDFGVLDGRSCKLESLDCSIEEGLQKFSLVGGKDGLAVGVNGTNGIDSKVVHEDTEADSDSDSESESDTSSSSSTSSSGSDDLTKELLKEEELWRTKPENNEPKGDAEEGEAMDSDAGKMVSWSDNDDDDNDNDDDEGQDDSASENCLDLELEDDLDDDDADAVLPKGPIRSKNELQDLPPVPQVTVSLQPNQAILPVGIVSSVLGTQVIVEGSENHNPISEGSILWISERKLPLGIIDEIFGPVKTPYYIVRYNSESEVPSDIQNGTAIGFVSEFVGHVLNDKNLYQKGYDASGENDEEIYDEAEFSDDEKEAEYRRMLKMSKRGNNNESQGPGNKKKNRSAKRRENTWTNSQPSTSHSSPLPPSQRSQGNQSGSTMIRPVFTGGPPAQSLGQNNQPGPLPISPIFNGGPNTFTQMPQPAPVMLNGNWGNGMPPQAHNMATSSGFQLNGNWPNGRQLPSQPQNMAMPNGFLPNGMPWVQQSYPQMPSNSPIPWQQQIDLSQLLTGFTGLPLGPMNFNMGAPNRPWSGMMGPNVSGQAPFMTGFQNLNPNGQMPVFSGFMPNGTQQAGFNSNSMPATSFPGNEDVSSQTHQGVSPSRGRGRARFQPRGGRTGR